jgi:hypothetical protein
MILVAVREYPPVLELVFIRKEVPTMSIYLEETIACEICGLERKNLTSHITRTHKMSVPDYKEKYGKGVISPKELNIMSNRIKGKNNPAYNHGGKLSPFSKNFIKYQNNSADYSIADVINKSKETKVENSCNNTTLEFYIKRGFAEEEAKIQLAERQATGRLDKFIDRYGDEEGNIKWTERQTKWQTTLKSKPKEEIEEINRKKSSGYDVLSKKYGHEKATYIIGSRNVKSGRSSKEAFSFFIKLYKKIRKLGIKREDIFLGTKKCNEYWINSDGFFRYDFTIKSLKIIIEYHGIAFHPKQGDTSWISPFGKTYDEMTLHEENKIRVAKSKGFSYDIVWSDDDLKEKLHELYMFIEKRYSHG